MKNEKADEKRNEEQEPKKPYRKPELRYLGSVRALTMGSAGELTDSQTPGGGDIPP
jgi:hypothetical protein